MIAVDGALLNRHMESAVYPLSATVFVTILVQACIRQITWNSRVTGSYALSKDCRHYVLLEMKRWFPSCRRLSQFLSLAQIINYVMMDWDKLGHSPSSF